MATLSNINNPVNTAEPSADTSLNDLSMPKLGAGKVAEYNKLKDGLHAARSGMAGLHLDPLTMEGLQVARAMNKLPPEALAALDRHQDQQREDLAKKPTQEPTKQSRQNSSFAAKNQKAKVSFS